MPQTFSQNGHTLWLMWTFWSSWPCKKPFFLVMKIPYMFLCYYSSSKMICKTLGGATITL
jgi:hypothetical protein